MNLEEVTEKERNLRKNIKKNCSLCMGRAHLNRQDETEKKQVLKDMKELYSNYQNKFDSLRREDASGNEIQNSLSNKRFILDTIDACNGCDREVDRANRAINELK